METGDSGEGATVLVVEDEPDLAELYRLWLADHHDVTVANGGEAALSALTDAVDVVLLDRRMPGMSGDAVLGEIRDSAHDPYVVMVTAVEADTDIADLPLDDYVTKPVTMTVLLDIVERMQRLDRAGPAVREYHSLERRRDVIRAARATDDVGDAEAFERLTRRLEAAARDAGPGLAWLKNEYYGPDAA